MDETSGSGEGEPRLVLKLFNLATVKLYSVILMHTSEVGSCQTLGGLDVRQSHRLMNLGLNG